MHLHRKDIIIAGFDVTNPSLDDCDDWINVARKANPSCPVMVAVGNKIDLVDKRQTSTEQARDHFAAMNPPMPYFETSALTGAGVNELFENAVRLYLKPFVHLNDNPEEPEHQDKRDKCIIC